MSHNTASAEKDTSALLLQCCDHDGDVATFLETELLESLLLNQMSQDVYFPIKGYISLQTLQWISDMDKKMFKPLKVQGTAKHLK